MVTDERAAGAALTIYSHDGVEERTLALRDRRISILGTEAAPGRLVVVAGFVKRHRRGGEAVLVDLDSGASATIAAGIAPAAYGWWLGLDLDAPAPGSAATRLFLRGATLLYLDPTTGSLKSVAGPAVS